MQPEQQQPENLKEKKQTAVNHLHKAGGDHTIVHVVGFLNGSSIWWQKMQAAQTNAWGS